MIWTYLIFGGMALLIIGTAFGVLLNRNSIYSALFLVANFSLVAVLYLILGAPFLALAQVTVYAGAIMVLFLFVIMLLGAERLSGSDPIKFHRPAAVLLALVMLVEAGALVVWGWGSLTPLPEPPAGYASPTDIGTLLFTKYALPFEITSIILLVALIGAVVLTRSETLGIRNLLKPKKKE
jgi:NADH-quinone oxidoreductase subunit J